MVILLGLKIHFLKQEWIFLLRFSSYNNTFAFIKSNHKGRGWQWTPVMDWRFKSFPCPGFSVWTSSYFLKKISSTVFCKARSSLPHDQIWAMPHFWTSVIQNLPCNRAKIAWLRSPQRVFRFKCIFWKR